MKALDVTLILELANTRHGPAANLDELPVVDEEHDHLSDSLAAVTYLAWRDLPVPRTSPTSRQLECLRELRDAALAVRDETPERFQGRLERILPRYAFRYGPDGGLVPATEGWDGFAARAVPGLFELVASRSRVHACSNPDCRWLFIDRSKNRSRVWCQMATCGSRAKMSRYRRRRTAMDPA